MFHAAQNRYRQVDNLTSVHDRSPAELTLLVYDRLLQRLASMERAIAQQRWEDMRAESSRALELLNEGLIAALSPERGGEVADNLGRLYDFAVRRLLHATLRKDAAVVREVAAMLAELRDGWAAIVPQQGRGPAPGAAAAARAPA